MSPRDVLSISVAVVEGVVVGVEYTYDERIGPRTVVSFVNLEVHLGDLALDTLELDTLGGPLPGGRFLDVPELPKFALGARYLVFLHAGPWFFSPVSTSHAYRVEADPARGEDILVNQQGQVLLGAQEDAFSFSPATIVEGRVDRRDPFLRLPLRKDADAVLAEGLPKWAFLEVLREAGGIRDEAWLASGPQERSVWSFQEVSRDPATGRHEEPAICGVEVEEELTCEEGEAP